MEVKASRSSSVESILASPKQLLVALRRSVSPLGSSAKKALVSEQASVEAQDFQLLDEEPPIACTLEGSIAPFSLPAEAFSFEPLPEHVMCYYKGGDRERRIHGNIELTATELEQLGALQREACMQGATFYPSVAAMATRFISRARGDHKKALKLMQATQAWREAYFKGGPIMDEDIMEDMAHGIVYFTGRDQAMRPAIVVRACRIPQQWWKEKRVDKFIRTLVFCMEYFLRYMVVPGRVENLSVIADMRGVGLGQCNLSFLSELNGVLSHHYIGRVCSFYVLNMPSSLRMIASAVKRLLTERQQQKIQILDDVTKLRKDFALHQLEEDMGGSRPAAERFFPFPLLPGPFEGNYAEGPDMDSLQGMHQVLTRNGAMGRLWHPSKALEANLELEYSQEAAAVALLQECGLLSVLEERPMLLGSGSRLSKMDKQESRSGSTHLLERYSSACTHEQATVEDAGLRNGVQLTSQCHRWGGWLFFGCCQAKVYKDEKADVEIEACLS